MEDQTNSQFTQNAPVSVKEQGKGVAIIAYLTIFGLLIAFILNNDKKNAFSAFHIRQSLGIGLTGIALGVIGFIPFIGWLISIFGSLLIVVLWIMGLINAINLKEEPVPILGKYYQDWFKNI